MPLIDRVELPVFESVKTCVAVEPTVVDAKANGDGESAAVVPVPVPLVATVCGLPEALVVMVTTPEWAPLAPGEYLTWNVHPAPGEIGDDRQAGDVARVK